MRNRVILLTAALLLASHAGMAQTQQPTPTPTPTAADFPWKGLIDFGGAFGSGYDGDEARYERYRDTRNGVYSDIALSHDGPTYAANFEASHIGYRDQRWVAGMEAGRGGFNFIYDSIPTNYLYGAFSPWDLGSATLTLNDVYQQAVQGPTNANNDGLSQGVPCAPGNTAPTCNFSTAAAQLANRSIYNVDVNQLDMRTVRKTLGVDGEFAVTGDLALFARFQSTSKSGDQPWGASFAFNNANELPLPIDQKTTDFGVGMDYAMRKGSVGVRWDGSWFSNDNQVLVWDNPVRLTDFNNGLAPPVNGPWDPNGYSNGNGPAQGRMSIFPSNSMNVITATGLYKFARATAINGALSFMSQSQDEQLIPWTINQVINANVGTATSFPHLAELPRDTADAKASGVNALLNFTTRPFRNLGLQARYRYNRRDVETEPFDAAEWVRFDAVPEEAEHSISEQFDVTRNNFDASATLSLLGYGSFKVAYAWDGYEREGRGFGESDENTIRLSYDVMGLSFFAIRVGYDYGQRRGDGFYLAGVDYEVQEAGEQPGLRYYDEADRDRSRAQLVISANPHDMASIYFQWAYQKDEFLGDEFIPEGREQFGLISQDTNSWNLGATINPNEKVAIGVNFGQDLPSAYQTSRNANPPPDPSWTDPNRNWDLTNEDTINNFNLWLDLTQAFKNVDLRFGWDYSDSDQSFDLGGPRVAALAATTPPSTGQFIPLPNVTNTWQRITADVKFFLTSKVGLGLGWYYEKLDVTDFATIDTSGSIFGLVPPTTATVAQSGVPRLEYLGEIMTGYANRPYEGNNFYVRALYRF